VAAAVDEERGSAGDPAEVGAVDVFANAAQTGALAEVVGEALDIELELRRIAHEVRRLQRGLMLEQQIVHRPERVPGGGGPRGLRGALGVGVHVGERQVAPDVAHVGEVAQQVADLGLRPAAVGALEAWRSRPCRRG